MFIENQDQDEEQKKQQAAQVGSGGGAATSMGGTTTGNPSTISPTAPQPEQKFASVQDYLGANKAQGNQLGGQLNTNLQGNLDTSKQTIDASAGAVKNQAQTNTVNYDPNLVKTAVSNPTKVTGDPNQLNSFLKQWNASYSGPSSFETTDEYAKASGATNKAAEMGQEAQDAGGRKQILSDQFGVKGQGNLGLDQTLVQNSDSFGQTQQLGQNLTSLQDYFSKQAQDVNKTTQTAADTTNKTQTDTRGALAGSIGNFQSDLNNRVAATQKDATGTTGKLQADLASGDAAKISEDLKSFNLSAPEKANLIDYLTSLNKNYGKNLDVSSYMKFNPNTDVNAANVATKDDYDKAAALQKLTGTDFSGVLNPADASKAGSWNTINNSLQGKDLDSALRQAAVQAELEALNPAPPTPGGSSEQPKDSNKLTDYLKKGLTDYNPGYVVPKLALNGLTSLGNSISDALGFGGGRPDAKVNLPAMQMPTMSTPVQASAGATKQIVDLLNKPLNMSGSYHEGAVSDATQRLGQLKDLYSQGQLTKDEYNKYAVPLATWVKSAFGSIMGASSQAANAAKPAYNQFVAGNFLQPIK